MTRSSPAAPIGAVRSPGDRRMVRDSTCAGPLSYVTTTRVSTMPRSCALTHMAFSRPAEASTSMRLVPVVRSTSWLPIGNHVWAWAVIGAKAKKSSMNKKDDARNWIAGDTAPSLKRTESGAFFWPRPSSMLVLFLLDRKKTYARVAQDLLMTVKRIGLTAGPGASLRLQPTAFTDVSRRTVRPLVTFRFFTASLPLPSMGGGAVMAGDRAAPMI